MSTLVIIWIACNANLMHVRSVPISSRDTTQETVHWVDGPNTRGTFELTLSCVITLLLCMWTSLHLNIPRQGETTLQRFWEKFQWTLLALFAPEVVVFVAWVQWMSARVLYKEINGLLGKNPVTRSSHNGAWTMTHSFYAVMGGFAFEVDDQTDFVQKTTGQTRISLTARGVLLLAKCGRLPNISEEFIIDKSKADALAKTLVCVQAGWCSLQYIGRLASDLPVSLLELNTLGHALCAFAIYLSWWYKPLDIKEPYVLSGDWVAPLCAYMWMSSSISPSNLKDDRNLKTEFIDLDWHRARREDATNGEGNDEAITLSQSQTLYGLSFPPHSRIFRPRERKQIVWTWTSPFDLHIKKTVVPAKPTVDLSIEDIRRWRLASNAINQYDGVMKDRVQDTYYRGNLLVEKLLDVPISNNGGDEGLISSDNFAPELMFTFISMAYGALHASAWNHFFSSWHERLLWRVSSIAIVGGGSLYALGIIWVRFIELLRIPDCIQHGIRYVLDCIRDTPDWILNWMFVGISLLPILAYCFCRMFLVVEAFVGLRELPAGVYITPSWSQLLPHL